MKCSINPAFVMLSCGFLSYVVLYFCNVHEKIFLVKINMKVLLMVIMTDNPPPQGPDTKPNVIGPFTVKFILLQIFLLSKISCRV